MAFGVVERYGVSIGFNGIRRATVGGLLDAIFQVGLDRFLGYFRFFITVPIKHLRTTGDA